MKVNGKMIYKKVMEWKDGLMDRNLKVIILLVKRMEEVSIYELIINDIRDLYLAGWIKVRRRVERKSN